MLKPNPRISNRNSWQWRNAFVAVAAGMAGAACVPAARAADLTVRIITQNVYQGTNFDEVRAATSPGEFAAAVTTTYNNILATQPAERAEALAREIAREQPDLVSLQEVATLLTGSRPATAVRFNYLQLLQADLQALGQDYSVIATHPELDAEAPSTLGFDVRLMTGDVLLARSSDNATLTNIHLGDYTNQLSIPTLPIRDLRGLASVDVSMGGATFRFASTHLTFPPVQLLQMNELISSTSGATLPLIIVGDFNANADNPADPTFATYQAAISAGFVDAWSDLVLLRGGIGVDDVHLIGESDGDRTTLSGLWPSDHAGVIADLEIPEVSIAVPEPSTWAMTLLGFTALGFAGWRAHNRQAPASEVMLLRS
jgi:endonuclease/exonuclease/phosphatase family metal-dependent hydrolase